MLLPELEEYLSNHFSDLSKTVGNQRRLLCLEHGLELDDIELLKQSINESLDKYNSITEHPVSWSVYATEIGYLFRGGEFWRTFEKETPGWNDLNAHHDLRRCFYHFRDHYNGAIPSGPWAEHFSIISWPITHAILPLDLQIQLAKVLYKIRHQLSDLKGFSPKQFGELISKYAWDSITRFHKLLEQPDLVGQIALSLLNTTPDSNDSLILSKTVDRIRQDLVQVNRARFWLQNAQNEIKTRIVLKGVSREKQQTTSKSPGQTSEKRTQEAQFSIRPYLQLIAMRPEYWRLRVTIPDYSTLLSLVPECEIPLTQSRIFVEGSSGRPIPPRGLLYGDREEWLREWPGTDIPLLKFEKTNPTLDTLLHNFFTIKSCPILFKINSEGTAIQIISNIIRPNSEYLILFEEDNTCCLPGVKKVDLECDGADLFSLKTSDTLSEDFISALENIGFQAGRQISVQPVGLSPVKWDGEGKAEWLTTEHPFIKIYASYPIKSYRVELSSDSIELSNSEFSPDDPHSDLYLKLPALAAGTYDLKISAVPLGNDQVESGLLNILIRNPVDNDASLSTRGAMQVNLYPPSSSLEEIWNGTASINILGPRSRNIRCYITLYDQNSHEVLYNGIIKSIRLPLTPSDWKSQFENNRQSHEDCQFAYGAAGSCELRFDGGDLGSCTIISERQLHPLRWAFNRSQPGYELRLVNENANISYCSVYFFSFENPDIKSSIEITQFRRIYKGAQAGLYVAECGNERSGIIIPPEITRLEDFRLTPSIRRRDANIENLIEIFEFWSNAHLANAFTSGRSRNRVLEVLLREMFRILGGKKWCIAERSRIRQDGQEWVQGMARTVPSRFFAKNWASAILQNLEDLSAESIENRIEYLANLIHEPRDIAEFAIRLASNPATVRDFAGDDFDRILNIIKRKTTIGRVARFYCLVIDNYLELESYPGSPLYPSWQWN